VVIHYEEALYQVYAHLPLPLGCGTCDQQVAGSTAGRRIARQRPWTSRSHAHTCPAPLKLRPYGAVEV